MLLVYFVQAKKGGLIKISSSYSVERRVRDLRKASEDMQLLAAVEGDEAEIKSRFAASLEHGEWYHASTRLVSFINAIAPQTQPSIEKQHEEGCSAFGAWLRQRDISYADAARELGITRSFAQLLGTAKADPSPPVSGKIEMWTREIDPADPVTIDMWS